MKEVKQFKTESKELLNLMINSIYSNKEIFLRELISNASDAIDKYRFLSLSNNEKYPTLDHFIRLDVDKKKRTITISDDGIGMSKDDLENSLGTIAKSGSKEFLEKFKEAKDKNDFNIIGQFGVGFYSAFMVADKVEVLTKNNDDKAYLFISEGKDSYSIEEAEKDTNGTQIVLHLKKSSKEDNYDEYLEEYEIKNLVKKYSDYVRYPIQMEVEVNKRSLANNVKFFGYLNNPLGIVKNSKIMIMTSIFEGTPMTALEALALNVPIVSTATDGMVDIITDGYNGYTYDTNGQAIKYITELLTDDNEYEKIVKNIEQFSNNYNNIQNYKNKLMEVYKN